MKTTQSQILTVEEAVEIVKAGRVKEERDGSIWVDGTKVRADGVQKTFVKAFWLLGQ